MDPFGHVYGVGVGLLQQDDLDSFVVDPGENPLALPAVFHPREVSQIDLLPLCVMEDDIL